MIGRDLHLARKREHVGRKPCVDELGRGYARFARMRGGFVENGRQRAELLQEHGNRGLINRIRHGNSSSQPAIDAPARRT
jgi:hypothetical protein